MLLNNGKWFLINLQSAQIITLSINKKVQIGYNKSKKMRRKI